ncbi:MAG: FtsQ-type POTRA domain-containing protein [Erysipelotrichaceae bacterium]|nr:FtsQ-type POTRA domain-containing protein [Erysipelotrichaceae bacterium]MDY5252329.1 FtsQ-type POTRA domain-containing protein [Erysipelotrichaceae bacterium]
MRKDNHHTIEDFDKQPQDINRVFDEHRNKRNIQSFKKNKNRIFRLAIALGILIIACTYYFSADSKIKAISIVNNYYLDSEYIKQLSGLSLENRYFLTFDFLIESRIKKDPMVKDVQVTHQANNIILIDIQEQEPYGYRIDSEIPQILLKNDTTIDLTSNYMGILANVPMIKGFNDENQTHLLTNAFNTVDQKMIESISQVEQYALSYDDQTLLVTLNDGNYFISSYYGLSIINSYNLIASKLTSNGVCIWADETNSVAYRSACPWEQQESTLEYWYDAQGNPVYNQYGDHAVKHYLTDKDGNFILDENGQKVVIPIDEFGNEIMPEPSQTPE